MPQPWKIPRPRRTIEVTDPFDPSASGTGNNEGSDTDTGSNPAGIFVTFAGGGTPPTITVEPVSETILLPTTPAAVFSLTATGDPVLVYTWVGFVEGTIVDGPNFSGQGTPSLTVTPDDQTWSGRQYFCVVSNGFGAVASSIVVLTVHALPVVSGPAAFTTFGIVGGNPFTIGPITLSLGSLPVTYNWEVSTDGGTTWSSASAAGFDVTSSPTECKNTGSSSTFPPLSYDGMLIRCTVSNAYGSGVSPNYSLEVRNPVTATSINYALVTEADFPADGAPHMATSVGVTAAPSGGYAPYTFLWGHIAGKPVGGTAPTFPTSASTTFTDTQTAPGSPGVGTDYGFWQLTVTDSKGNTGGMIAAVGFNFAWGGAVFTAASPTTLVNAGAPHGSSAATNLSAVVGIVWSTTLLDFAPAGTSTGLTGGGTASVIVNANKSAPGAFAGFMVAGGPAVPTTGLVAVWILFT